MDAELTCAEPFCLELVRPECTDVYVLIELIGLSSYFCGNISDHIRRYFRSSIAKEKRRRVASVFCYLYSYNLLNRSLV